MEVLWMLFGLIVASALYGGARYRAMVLEVRDLRAQIADLEARPATVVYADVPQATAAPDPDDLMALLLPGAGDALAAPPSDFQQIMRAISQKGPGDYRIPLGWYVSPTGASLATGQIQGDINHILLTGQSDSGKDNAALGIILSLAYQYSPDKVQFAIVDGKGLDWIGWQDKAHTWRLATDPEQIGGAMEALTAERQRRREILANARVSKWDNYHGGDLPLLVVFVSELLLLENAVGARNLTTWLNTELTAARAFGIRYILATQTASNFATQWRSQVSLFMAGYQPAASQDTPNTGLTTSEMEALDGVPPSKLPAPASGAQGVFGIVQGQPIVTTRTTFIRDAQRDELLRHLPTKDLHLDTPRRPQPRAERPQNPDQDVLLHLLQTGQPLPLSDTAVGGPTEPSYRALSWAKSDAVERPTTSPAPSAFDVQLAPFDRAIELVLPEAVVPAEEQQRILEEAPNVKSKRQLALRLYNVDGGQKYTWVRQVCDAAGLLG